MLELWWAYHVCLTTSDMSAVYGLENKAIKFFWHCVFFTTKEGLKKGSYKNVVFTGGPLALLVGETALQPPPALLCVRDLFSALFITTSRPPE